MKKREWMFGAIGAGFICVLFQVYQNRKQQKATEKLGECHDTFVHFQEDWNHSMEDQLLSIQDEISTVYSHMDKLLESVEEKSKRKEL